MSVGNDPQVAPSGHANDQAPSLCRRPSSARSGRPTPVAAEAEWGDRGLPGQCSGHRGGWLHPERPGPASALDTPPGSRTGVWRKLSPSCSDVKSPPPRAPPPRLPSSGHREGQRGRGQAARGSVELPTNVAQCPRGPPARPDRVCTGARGLQCCPRTLACLVSTAPDFPGGLASASSDPSSAGACGEPIGASGHRHSRGPPGASFHLQGRPPPCVSFILTVAPRRGLGGHRSPAAGVPHAEPAPPGAEA